MDVSLNACGGTSQLADEPGKSCGACDFGQFVCSGLDAITCEDEIGCPPNYISLNATTDIKDDKATLNAVIVAVDEEDSPIDHGFCWTLRDDSGESVSEQCKSLGELTKADEGKEIQLEIKDLLPGHRYYAQAFLVMADNPNDVNRSRTRDFLSFAPAPAKVTASKDQSEHVLLSWEAAPDALRYEVYRDDKHLAELDETLENGATTVKDTTADLGTLTFPAQIPVPPNDSQVFVLLNGVAATSADPESHKYTVVAVYPDATSELSNGDEGKRTVGDITYRWMGSRPGNDISFEELTVLSNPIMEYRDLNAASDGTPRNYYLEAFAPGAVSKISNRITGKRKKGTGLLLKTLAAVEVKTATATLNAEITDLGDAILTERGFCYGKTDESIRCDKVDDKSEIGKFSMNLSGLSAGTLYFFQAYVKSQNGETKGNETSFLTVPSKVVLLNATKDLPNAVNITWQAVTGATNYNVYAGPVKIATVDGQSLMFTDTDADAPTYPNNPEVTVVNKPTHVELSWPTPAERLGTERQYRVTAENASGEGAKSEPQMGRRRYLVTGYRLRINDGDVISLNNVNSYHDKDAPNPVITPGILSATKSILQQVILNSAGESVSPGAKVKYVVSTMNAAGESPVTSVEGKKTAAPLSYTWELKESANSAAYKTLATTTGPTYTDPTLLQSSTSHMYRVKYSSPGAQEKISNEVNGP